MKEDETYVVEAWFGKWTRHLDDECSKISADLPPLECSQCITR